jgi:hypothetical protein
MSLESAMAAAASECVTMMAPAPLALISRAAAQDAVRGIGIEIAGRFVGQQQGGPVHQRARDRHALQFAAGQLVREVGAAPFQPTAASMFRPRVLWRRR